MTHVAPPKRLHLLGSSPDESPASPDSADWVHLGGKSSAPPQEGPIHPAVRSDSSAEVEFERRLMQERINRKLHHKKGFIHARTGSCLLCLEESCSRQKQYNLCEHGSFHSELIDKARTASFHLNKMPQLRGHLCLSSLNRLPLRRFSGEPSGEGQKQAQGIRFCALTLKYSALIF